MLDLIKIIRGTGDINYDEMNNRFKVKEEEKDMHDQISIALKIRDVRLTLNNVKQRGITNLRLNYT